MDAKAAARAELIREREAGLWHSDGEEFSGALYIAGQTEEAAADANLESELAADVDSIETDAVETDAIEADVESADADAVADADADATEAKSVRVEGEAE